MKWNQGLIKVFVLVSFWMTYTMTFAQDYERVDASILLYPEKFEAVEELSRFISRDFISEEDKVRAIYSWIILNVAYDPDEYKKFDYKFKNFRERNSKEEKTRDAIIKRTLRKGIAVCEGYSMLFEKLCELQGISNYLVRGDVKSNFDDIGRPFKQSHMWNAAVIDGQTYLFDPTWGAGKYNGEFIKDPSYFYYKTNPELFLKTHYPSMFEDAFVEKVVSREVFSNMPLLIKDDLKMDQVESPLQGVIQADEYYDTIPFVISNCDVENVSYLLRGKKIPVKNMEIKEGRLHFGVPLELGMKNLLIYFDDKPALAFRVQ